MALTLDGETEAIEHGIQDAGWEFSGQWLPWTDHFDPGEADVNARRAQRRMQRDQEGMPGVLVFRREIAHGQFANEVLFAFVVPETLTSGINGPSFNAALHFAGALSNQKAIGILGPSFSGSFPSLARLLHDWQVEHKQSAVSEETRPINHTVYSGTVSNFDYATAFKQKAGLDFHGGVLDSQNYQKVLCAAVQRFGGAGRFAILKEDEGGLQQSFAIARGGKVCEHDVYIFPRDISHLRNASQESRNGARNPYADSNASVDFSIKDPDYGEDSIPTFADVQTPVTQSAVVTSITDDLKRKHIRVVFISATSTLDTLFLLRTVRQNCPNARVLIEGPNVLFIPAAARAALTGTIFFSPYPMFVDGNTWLDGSRNGGRHPMFNDSSSQGLYNSTQLLLNDIGAHFTGLQSLVGYNQFGRSNEREGKYPGMWTLILNRTGFLPINFEASPTPNWFQEGPFARPTLPPYLDRAPLAWEFSVGILSAAILLACGLLLWANVFSAAGWPVWLLLSGSYRERLPALFAICASMSGLMFVLTFPAWRSLPPSPFPFSLLRWSYVAACVIPMISYLFILLCCFIRSGVGFRVTGPPRLAALLYYGLTLAVYLSVLVGWQRFCTAHESSFFFRYRVFELYSGASPALPYAIAFVIFFYISLVRFRRYTLGGQGRPRLKVARNSEYQERFADAYHSIENEVGAPLTLKWRDWLPRFLFGTLIAGGSLLIVRRNAFAFELRGYNWLLAGLVLVILFYIGSDLYDFVKLWSSIRRWLELLQLRPLQPALKRISRSWPRCAVWSFGRLTTKQSVERQMLNTLEKRVKVLEESEMQNRSILFRRHALIPAILVQSTSVGDQHATVLTAASAVDLARNDFESLHELLFKETGGPKGTWITGGVGQHKLERINRIQQYNAELAYQILDVALTPDWKHLKSHETGNGDQSSPDTCLNGLYIDCCEDFVMLQYTRFIVYVMAHIKRIGSSLSLSFLLLVLLFHSYSPQGPQIIGRFLAIFFLGIGAVVWHVFAGMERNAVLSRNRKDKAW